MAIGCSHQWNGSPERQMPYMITESFRASARRVLPAPDRLAIACAHSLGHCLGHTLDALAAHAATGGIVDAPSAHQNRSQPFEKALCHVSLCVAATSRYDATGTGRYNSPSRRAVWRGRGST